MKPKALSPLPQCLGALPAPFEGTVWAVRDSGISPMWATGQVAAAAPGSAFKTGDLKVTQLHYNKLV